MYTNISKCAKTLWRSAIFWYIHKRWLSPILLCFYSSPSLLLIPACIYPPMPAPAVESPASPRDPQSSLNFQIGLSHNSFLTFVSCKFFNTVHEINLGSPVWDHFHWGYSTGYGVSECIAGCYQLAARKVLYLQLSDNQRTYQCILGVITTVPPYTVVSDTYCAHVLEV